jgi:hypothetical protein
MQAKLEALVRTDPRPAFIVALLEIWKPPETQPALLPDPADTVKRLAAAGVPPSRAQVRAILETIEGLYRYDKTVDYKGASDKLRSARTGRSNTFLIGQDPPPRRRSFGGPSHACYL